MRIANLASLSIDSIASFKDSFIGSLNIERILAIAFVATFALGALAFALLYFWHKKSQSKVEEKEADAKTTTVAAPIIAEAKTSPITEDKEIKAIEELNESLMQVKHTDEVSLQKAIAAFEVVAETKFEKAKLSEIDAFLNVIMFIRIELNQIELKLKTHEIETMQKTPSTIDLKNLAKELDQLLSTASETSLLKILEKKTKIIKDKLYAIMSKLPFTTESKHLIAQSQAFLSYVIALNDAEKSKKLAIEKIHAIQTKIASK